MRAIAQAFRLALADLWRDRWLAFCQMFALAAVLTPLLILGGLYHGVLGRLIGELQANPAMREITPRVTGNNRFDEAWLATARARADVAFVSGTTRATAAEVELSPAAGAGDPAAIVTLLTTGPGDPLAEAGAALVAADDQIALAPRIARLLRVAAGDEVALIVPRTLDGDQSRRVTLTVAAVLSPTQIDEMRAVAFVTPGFALDVQAYRDGFAVAARGWDGNPPPGGGSTFQRFRLYARSIEDVAAVADWLRGDGIDPVTRLAEIGPTLELSRSLGLILGIIAAFALAGYAVALAANQWAQVERKGRDLALLALVGYGRAWLLAVPMLQALVLGLMGALLSLGLFAGAAAVINRSFPAVAGQDVPACTLPPLVLAGIVGATMMLAALAALAAAIKATRIEPARVLRDTV